MEGNKKMETEENCDMCEGCLRTFRIDDLHALDHGNDNGNCNGYSLLCCECVTDHYNGDDECSYVKFRG